MGAGVGEAVGGHNAIETGTAHPVVQIPVFFFHIDVFNTGAGWDDEFFGGLSLIAAVVEPVGALGNIGEEPLFDFAREDVAAGVLAGLIAAERAGVPDEALSDDEIFWAAVATFFVGSDPQVLAGLGIDGFLRAIAASVKDGVAVEEDARSEVELIELAALSWRVGKQDIAGFDV